MTDLRKGAVDGAKTYDLGHAAAELERLKVQAAVMAPITRRLFEEAGIGPGMRILDIGSGAGDVAILLADLVGPAGEVVGSDRAPEAVKVARARIEALSLGNVTFRECDPGEMAFDQPFDACVGRYILRFPRATSAGPAVGAAGAGHRRGDPRRVGGPAGDAGEAGAAVAGGVAGERWHLKPTVA